MKIELIGFYFESLNQEFSKKYFSGARPLRTCFRCQSGNSRAACGLPMNENISSMNYEWKVFFITPFRWLVTYVSSRFPFE